MDSFIDFKPPQLPPMMTGAQLSKHVGAFYPELPPHDDRLRDLAAAMDAYSFARGEYEARNSRFAEWMVWYKKNPTQKDKVVAFVTEHNIYFGAGRSALQMLDKAVARLVETLGDRNNLSSIRSLLASVDSDKKKLADNLQALQSASSPSGLPQIRPQKRAAVTPTSEPGTPS